MNLRYIFFLGLFFSFGKFQATSPRPVNHSTAEMIRLEKSLAEVDQENPGFFEWFFNFLFGDLITRDDFIYLFWNQVEQSSKDIFLDNKQLPGQKDAQEQFKKWLISCVKVDEKDLKLSTLLSPNIASGTSPKDIAIRFLINAAIKEGLDQFLQKNQINDDFLKQVPGAKHVFSPVSRILVARFLKIDKILNAIPFGNLIAEKIRPIPMHKASHFASMAECLFDTFQKTEAFSTIGSVVATFAPKYVASCVTGKFNPIDQLTDQEKSTLQKLKTEFIKVFITRAAIKAGVIIGCHLTDKTIIKIKKARAARRRNKKIKSIINSCA